MRISNVLKPERRRRKCPQLVKCTSEFTKNQDDVEKRNGSIAIKNGGNISQFEGQHLRVKPRIHASQDSEDQISGH